MDKKGYEELGYQHAKAGDSRRFKVNDACWQAAAYWRGVRRAMAEEASKVAEQATTKLTQIPRDPGKARHVIDLSRMDANTKNWPSGAKQHALLLAADLNQEANPSRRNRLYRALARLQLRHGLTDRPKARIWIDELAE